MARETLEQLVEKAKQDFKNNSIAAFLGIVQSGKTVVSALLYYHLMSEWIPKSNGRWEAVASSGDEAINKIVREMKRGMFTSPTQKNDFPRLVVNVYSMEGNPSKIQLALHDMSGESYINLLTEEMDSAFRLKKLLTGDGAYIIFAKHYVIMIDCEKRDEWDTDICKVSKMVTEIKEMREKIYGLEDGRIHTPISVVFTKTDRLKPEEQELSPNELLKLYPSLHSSLKINHDNNLLSCFKVHVKSEEEPHEARVERIRIANEELQKKFNDKMETIRVQVDAAVEQAAKAAREKAAADGLDQDQTEEEIRKSKTQVLEQNKEQLNQKPPTIDDTGETASWKVSVPLQYSKSEYDKLISFIVTQKHDQ